jgi:acyl carrier protein
MNEMKEIIMQYVKKEYLDDDQEIAYDTPLISGGIVDSFSMSSLKLFLERQYKIVFPANMATPESFDTIDSIAFLMEGLLK